MLFDLRHPWANNLYVLFNGKITGACIAACPVEGWILRYQYDEQEDGSVLLKTTPWVDGKREVLDPIYEYGNVKVMTKEGQLVLL